MGNARAQGPNLMSNDRRQQRKRPHYRPFGWKMARLAAWLRSCVLLCAFAVIALPALAQTSPPPTGMSKEQFDALVEAISETVVQKLNAPKLRGALRPRPSFRPIFRRTASRVASANSPSAAARRSSPFLSSCGG